MKNNTTTNQLNEKMFKIATFNFINCVEKIKAESVNSFAELEQSNPALLNEYSACLDTLIKPIMYSAEEYIVHEKNKDGSLIVKLDEDGKPITCTNSGMVSSLCQSGFMNKYTIQYELWHHIMKKEFYFIYSANDANHLINLLVKTIHNKLCDFIRAMRRSDLYRCVSIYEPKYDEDGNEMENEIADKKCNIETDIFFLESINIYIHDCIHHYIAKSPHKLIGYLTEITSCINTDVTNPFITTIINRYGYNAAISFFVKELQRYDIDISYLESFDLSYTKKSHDSILKSDLEHWRSEGCKQARKYMANRGLSLYD